MSGANPIRLRGIDHVVLQVTDIAKSLAFYVDVLGFRVERVIDGVGIYQMRCGRNLVDLCVLGEGQTLAPRGARGIDHLCLSVDGSMDAIVAWLEGHGIALGSPVRELYGADGYGTSVYVYDPDEHIVELKLPYCEHPMRIDVATAQGMMTRPPEQ